MVRLRLENILVFLIVADTVPAFIGKTKWKVNDIKSAETRRKGTDRSTSSDQNDGKSVNNNEDKSGDGKESLDISSERSDSKDRERNKKYTPKSSVERRGWRKWHRKCAPCPDDLTMKWRDPRVNWICGGYQRARRTFKSTCMMHFRNCQDGTMFVKLHNNRCDNDTGKLAQPYGRHFFYDYKASLVDDSSSSGSSESSSSSSSSSSGSSSTDDARRAPRDHRRPHVTAT